ncbi:MAG: GDP-mannose 4,6-dehydratase [Candidatus Acidiferrales bacterium]
MNYTALVTGAEGFIGSHMVKFLQAKGWTVVGSYLAEGITPFPKLPNLTFVQCDLRNGQRATQLVSRCQPTHIFHFGAQSLPTVSWADPVRTFESNIMGSLYLFEAARHAKRHPIVVSACSSAEYGHVSESAVPVREEQPLKPLHPYGISKVCLDLLSHEYYLDYGIPVVNIRLFNTTGPGKTDDAPSDFVRQLVRIKKGLQRPVVEVGNLKPRRAFLDVDDAVRGFYKAASRGRRGEAYNLCAERTYEMSEVLRIALALAGVDATISPVRRLMRPSDERIIFGSTDKLRKDTGWRPRNSIRQTLTAMLKYWESAIQPAESVAPKRRRTRREGSKDCVRG